MLVILRIETGDFTKGFAISLRIIKREGDTSSEIAVTGTLPAAPDLPELYQNWQVNYCNLGKNLRLGAIPIQSNVNLQQVSQKSGNVLKAKLNQWLNSFSFQPIRDKLLEHLSPDAIVRILLQTDNPLLQKLPWHLWDVLERYPRAELALASLNYSSLPPRARQGKVKILAILGHSQNIDLQQDRQLLSQLPDSKVTFLVEPSLSSISDRLWLENWDILFFAGHSISQADSTGKIYLNPTESLTVEQLKKGLAQAVNKGLQLAIFNSCDGLGLARDLARLQIPYTIVMREPVPDKVAQQFLTYFLSTFTQGNNFYLAVREARERLEGLSSQFPFANWLPVIWQHPSAIAPNWQQWTANRNRWRKTNLIKAGASSLLVTTVCLGIRWLGMLEPLELWAYDRALQFRPLENPDSRITMIAIAETDIQQEFNQQENLKGSISDRTLSRLLAKLENYQPRAIGLDLYRDYPIAAENKELRSLFRNSQKIIGLCKVRDANSNLEGIPAPPDIPIERIGFSDFLVDRDGVLRRQLLFMDVDPLSSCTTPYSLSVQLATRYLAAEGIQPQFTPTGDLQLGETIFTSIKANTGGYQRIDSRGSQILLNYRSLSSAEQIANVITLDRVLNDRINPQLFQDKIILIGVTARSAGDYWTTPRSRSLSQQVPGVAIQAQKIGQIISAVKDNRPLLQSLSEWQESLWLLVWSLIGSCIALILDRVKYRAIAIAVTTIAIVIICQFFFLHGIWLPSIPSILILLTAMAVFSYVTSLEPKK